MKVLVWILLSHFGPFDVALNTYESWGQCQAERLRVIREAGTVPNAVTCVPDNSGN